ncbi:multicopper oxidase domain-containing protein, partial [Archangium sp.]|uniref:multicopper oxidase domain-containing protein n=1 Tax=Archangium sp. TaxID=1872627 RepID=UPI002D48C6DC
MSEKFSSGHLKNLLAPQEGQSPKPGQYTITVRTRYQRYIGEFVLHCHILDHEDQGMMQNVSIELMLGHQHPACWGGPRAGASLG